MGNKLEISSLLELNEETGMVDQEKLYGPFPPLTLISIEPSGLVEQKALVILSIVTAIGSGSEMSIFWIAVQLLLSVIVTVCIPAQRPVS